MTMANPKLTFNIAKRGYKRTIFAAVNKISYRISLDESSDIDTISPYTCNVNTIVKKNVYIVEPEYSF